MSYGSWSFGTRRKEDVRAYNEKGYRRQPLPDWDDRWHKLSVEARRAFLEQSKGPTKPLSSGTLQPSVSTEKFHPDALAELTTAGFLRVEPPKLKTKPGRVFVELAALDFARRVRTLYRVRLLDPNGAGDLTGYLNAAYNNGGLTTRVAEILDVAGIDAFDYSDEGIRRHLTNRRWPGWVVSALNAALAGCVVQAVREAGGPVPIVALAQRVEGAGPTEVRAAIDRLVAPLALVEDLDRETLDVVVDFLPEVRSGMETASLPRSRPPLEAVGAPADLGPTGGPLVDDLRGLLLEVAAEPPRLRQNGLLFSKETDRFLAALPPLSQWLAEGIEASPIDRLNDAYEDAMVLKLVRPKLQAKESRLLLTDEGRAWLSAPAADQYNRVYDSYRLLPKAGGRDAGYSPLDDFDLDESYRFGWGYRLSDGEFLGVDVAVVKGKRGSKVRDARLPKTADLKALREAFGGAFRSLSEGKFYRLDDVVGHFAFGSDNVLLMGHEAGEVRVSLDGRPVPPLEEELEVAAREALDELAKGRLIPLGCLQAARDEGGALCVARTRRLDAYFGSGPVPEEPGTAAVGERVVVQPDFSVVVIGLGTAALAELAPFCERTARNSGPGATVLKITRDSVVKAIAQGLTPREVQDRLTRHASHAPPANVLREVREWSGWVRKVKAEALTVLRCPDRDTADRVVAALKRSSERLNETVIALGTTRLTPAERKKLKDQGVLVEGSADPDAPASRAGRGRFR